MTPDERALLHAQERHDAELEADAIFSHVEHQEPIRADVDAAAVFVAGPVMWTDQEWDEFEDVYDDGWSNVWWNE